ncbi:protein of unknown function [Paenibacillus sp. UNCCL117]|uniref:DUF4340 domain-containing protein n=1 Tax=unclassified Paenibacillus TaxID=185978 RepID=UPI0008828A95|nr:MULTISPECIES: DUF4340 domain-containing protein [unclassified Paenibacillus]SDE51633.1 protein of unknown function [Paenibacillus sp. cl123]SFW67107.1 protein of unknown function [Paenibacillus sp. UNCCL117]
MKRLIPTILLVILCIGGFWYASSKDFFREKPPETPALVTVNKEDVTGFTIRSGETEIVMERREGAWTMTKPSPLPLTAYDADAWVNAFASLKKDKIVTENASDPGQFGLAEPKQRFTVKLASGVEQTLEVGDATPIGSSSYAKLSGTTAVFQLADATLQQLAKQPIDFMEKSAVKIEYEKIRSLAVDWQGTSWALTKSEPDKSSFEAKWKLGERELAGPDATGYMDRAASLVTEQLVKPAAEVKGLDQPELRLSLKTADEAGKETETAYAGKLDGATVWVARQGGEWAYAVPAEAVQELADHGKDQPETEAEAQPSDAAAPQG